MDECQLLINIENEKFRTKGVAFGDWAKHRPSQGSHWM